MPTTTRSQRRRQPTRSPGSQQRRPSIQTTRNLEPPDYTRDYQDVRRDLRLIAIISSVLTIGMIGVSFAL